VGSTAAITLAIMVMVFVPVDAAAINQHDDGVEVCAIRNLSH
jgi:hypothetical protein